MNAISLERGATLSSPIKAVNGYVLGAALMPFEVAVFGFMANGLGQRPFSTKPRATP